MLAHVGKYLSGAAIVATMCASIVVHTASPARAADALEECTDNGSGISCALSGHTERIPVPDGVSTVSILLSGGDGGNSHASRDDFGAGARIDGQVSVNPGDTLILGVGGHGGSATSHNSDPVGGYGALGTAGGNGNSASDSQRTSAAGGGATTLQIEHQDGTGEMIAIAAGGGGGAGPSGEAGAGFAAIGSGGTAGENGAIGSDGHSPNVILSGKGGAGGGAPTGAGERGRGGSGLGGNGGGGGGGFYGGSGGSGASGTSAGGGGGSGDSYFGAITNLSITPNGDNSRCTQPFMPGVAQAQDKSICEIMNGRAELHWNRA